tara:strand:- start:21181 stop:21642 length:462 start_codon:yes stop_codon:yes gene_type:complete
MKYIEFDIWGNITKLVTNELDITSSFIEKEMISYEDNHGNVWESSYGYNMPYTKIKNAFKKNKVKGYQPQVSFFIRDISGHFGEHILSISYNFTYIFHCDYDYDITMTYREENEATFTAAHIRLANIMYKNLEKAFKNHFKSTKDKVPYQDSG